MTRPSDFTLSQSERKHEHAVAALEVDLRVSTRRYGNVLLALDGVRHRGRIHAGAALELPQYFAGLGIVGFEPAVAFAVEDKPARRCQHAADQGLRSLHSPRDLAGIYVNRDQPSPLFFAGNQLERAAEPQFAAGI